MNMTCPITVMVTGAGAPGTIGTLFAIKNNPDRIKFKIITTDIGSDAVGQYLSECFYAVPPPEDESYIKKIDEIVKRENVKIILPQTTREIEVLAQQSGHFNELGAVVIASGHRSVKEANDKSMLLVKAKEIGIPYPSFVMTHSRDEFVSAVNDFGYPGNKVVVKPPVSNGMRGVRILARDKWDVKRFLKEKPDGIETDLENILKILSNGEWPPLLVVEYLEGVEYTIDVFRNRLGVVVIPRLRKNIRSGITFEACVDYRKDLIEYSSKLAEACDLQYCFGFQFKLSKEGVPKLLECNPRVQGTMVLSAFAGFNVVYYSIREALGYHVDTGAVRLKNNVRFKRYWGGIATEDGSFLGKI